MSDAEDTSLILLSAGSNTSHFFRSVHGREMAAMSSTYPLPVDTDEHKRSELHHRLMQFVFSGKNYIGPVKEALQFGQRRRILDLGTGKGQWAIDMADEFPRAEVIGIDVAPIQPEFVPPNCQFEICNLDEDLPLPYPAESFDLIHARSAHIGIQNYPLLLQEIERLLRPGGVVLLVEPDLFPAADKEDSSHLHPVARSSDGRCSSPLGQDERGGRREQTGHSHSRSRQGQPTDYGEGSSHQEPHGSPARSNLIAGLSEDSTSRKDNAAHVSKETSSPMPSGDALSPSPELQSHTRINATSPRTHDADPSSSSSSTSPPRPRGPTTNRRHLDFILNHAPDATSGTALFLQPSHNLPSGKDLASDKASPVADDASIPSGNQTSTAETVSDSRQPATTMQGWSTLWSTFRACLQDREAKVDVNVPSTLGSLLSSNGGFEHIVVKQANVPVGVWPEDPTLLTVGQLQWMDYELLVPALRPFFLASGIPEEDVEKIIRDAQHDLYYPTVPFHAHTHIAYASKRLN